MQSKQGFDCSLDIQYVRTEGRERELNLGDVAYVRGARSGTGLKYYFFAYVL